MSISSSWRSLLALAFAAAQPACMASHVGPNNESPPRDAGPGDTTPPSAPADLSASATGASAIDLAWTASSDDVGVTGYVIERCAGASCTNFAQVATTSATSATDSGLTAGTTYSYRARATDAAGNMSEYSNTATATTSQSGTILFDGRAVTMTSLTGGSSQGGTQSPDIWTCLCFVNHDISLAADTTNGKGYQVAVAFGDTNGYGGTTGLISGAGQLSVRQNNDLGKTDYYAIALKVPSWSGSVSDIYWTTIMSLGYQTSSGDQLRLGLMPDANGNLAYEIQENAGSATIINGFAQGTNAYRAAIGSVTYGQWQEFVLAVKWATDNTGAVVVYSRPAGGSWSQVFSKTGVPTYLYGVTQNGTFAQDGSNWGTIIDKMGLYFGYYDGSTSAQSVYESGFTISSDLATAESTLP
jgi:hypothetical protein